MSEVKARRRDDILMAAIHDATLLELAEHGYQGVSFEGVARRARTSKPVLYRRYRNRAEMVLDAIGQSAIGQVTTPDTGALRTDVIGVLEQVNHQFSRFSADVYRGVIGESVPPLLDDALAAVGAVNRHTMRTILDVARARGELGSTPLPERVVLLPIALLRYELLFGQPFDPEAIAAIVDDICLPLMRTLSRGAQGSRELP